jgi:hypothetical protein
MMATERTPQQIRQQGLGLLELRLELRNNHNG